MNDFYTYPQTPNEIYHFGIKRRSGRYPWGSEDRLYQNMIRPDYDERFKRCKFVLTSTNQITHSAKGTTWEDHKYIKRIDGTYYYSDNYEGGRHLPENDKEPENKEEKPETKDDSSKLELSDVDIENLAREVIRGNFGNGQERKDLLGKYYNEIQKLVNELIESYIGSKRISEKQTEETIKIAEDAAKKISKKDSNVHSGVDMNQVLNVYG